MEDNIQYTLILNSAGEGIVGLDTEGKITFVNPAVEKILGWKAEELIGKVSHSLYHHTKQDGTPYPREECPIYNAFKKGIVQHNVDEPFWRKDGTSLSVEYTSTPMFEDGNIAGAVVVFEDITERKLLERNLRESEERYRSLFGNMLNGFAYCKLLFENNKPCDFIYIDVNDAFEKQTGLKNVIGKKLSEVIPGIRESNPKFFGVYGRVATTGKPERFERYLKELSMWFSVSVYSPQKGYFVIVFDNITERKKAEETISAEKERLAVTLRSIADGVITTDIKGNIALMNKSAEKFTGWKFEEARGKSLMDVFNIISEKTGKRCENPVGNVLKTSGVLALASDTILISKDGTKRVIADSVAPIKDRESKIIGAVIVFSDTTEKRKIEEEQLKATKLESVGILAGGIAHDFNNILTVISGNLAIAKTLIDPKDKLYVRFSELEKALIRAESLTQQLLTFSKGGAPVKKAATIRDLIKDTVTFALRGSNVRCEFSFPEKLYTLEIDEGQISQVINNLVINARQAMPKGGTIKVSFEYIANSMNIADYTGTLLKEGEYARISVKDEGVGIPKESLTKIFDPYYTTKEKGSGLGLTTSYSIIKNHGGLITVESEAGVGTTFHIYLPALKGQITENEETMTEESRDDKNKGKILVMDDDELVRDVIGGMLEVLGYRAKFAVEGKEAIELYKKAGQTGAPFDAVIMDLTIPGGMGGKDAIKELLELDPKVKGIVSSGYSTDPIMADFRKYGFSGIVVKPYKLNELGEALRNVITSK